MENEMKLVVQVGALCGVFIIIAAVIFTIRFIMGLRTLGTNSEPKSLKSVS